MGLFKKKPDQVSERARQLNAEIAALEAQIKKLSSANDERAGNCDQDQRDGKLRGHFITQ